MAAVISAIDGVLTHLGDYMDSPNIDYKSLVVTASWLQTGFEVYLSRRQLSQYALKAPPAELKEHLSQENFTKSQAYGLAKARFQLLKLVCNQTISWLMVKYGVYAETWNWAASLMSQIGLGKDRIIMQSLIWFSILSWFSIIPGLPWDYYYTFYLEEAHGFNKSTRGLWIVDQIKTIGLFAVFGLPIVAGFLKIVDWAGRSFVVYVMVFLMVVLLVLQVVYPLFIQPLFNKVTPLPDGDLRTRVETLAGKLGFPLKHLYVIDGSKRSGHSNAYFYGLPWSKQIVIYDTLIDKSSPAEVEAVLGHELGHWYYAHPTKLLIIGQLHLLFVLTVFSIFIHNRSLYAAFDFDPRLATSSPRGGPQPIIIGFMLFQMILEPLDTLVKFLMNAQTRKYEYQADEFAVLLHKKEDLASALIKLHIDNLSSPHNDALYSMYHHSHPTLPERLRAMDVFKPTTPLKLKGE